MTKFVVLLRGVNVGKANRVPMIEFKLGLEALGCSGVRTWLNSGNAILTSTVHDSIALAQDIASMVQARLAVTTSVIVKSASEFEEIVAGHPNPPQDGAQSMGLVAFAMQPRHLEELLQLQTLLEPGETFEVRAWAAYLQCADGVLRSRAGEALLGRAGRSVTTRNWATVLKLKALLEH